MRSRPARLPVLLALLTLGLSACELIVRFDRDRIEDAGVRLDGEVVGSGGG